MNKLFTFALAMLLEKEMTTFILLDLLVVSLVVKYLSIFADENSVF